jgi:hypothetical protein
MLKAFSRVQGIAESRLMSQMNSISRGDALDGERVLREGAYGTGASVGFCQTLPYKMPATRTSFPPA